MNQLYHGTQCDRLCMPLFGYNSGATTSTGSLAELVDTIEEAKRSPLGFSSGSFGHIKVGIAVHRAPRLACARQV